MQQLPYPDADEKRDNASFEAILQCLARPGQIADLPETGLAVVAQALVDGECHVFTPSVHLMPILQATGARSGLLREADHVFLQIDSEETLAQLEDINTGSQLYPDDGATLVVPAQLGDGRRLEFSGPGIEHVCSVRIGNVHPGFWALRNRLCTYPLGFEVLFVDEARILGLPRSTTVKEA